MSTEKKSRGRQAKPGIPFKKQTPKQRAIVALIGALGSYGYREAKYVANKFLNEDAIKHMNMPLLAKVLAFIEQYNIEEQLENTSFANIDYSELKDLTPKNIENMNNGIFQSSESKNPQVQYNNNVDFVRYFIFAVRVLKSTEITEENTEEINLITETAENR